MDKKSLMDQLNEKQNTLITLKENTASLTERLNSATDITSAKQLDEKLTKNATDIINVQNDIINITAQIEGMDDKMAKSNKNKSYIETSNAVEDWAAIMNSASNQNEAQSEWKKKLAENGITLAGDVTALPAQVDLGIQSAIASNPVFDLFTKAPGNDASKLVIKKFATSDTAVVRGTKYNITEQKTEQDSTLTVKALDPNQIYKLTSVDYRALKTIGNQLTPFIATELSQYVIDKIVELALYDGEGSDDTNQKGGFESIVATDASVKVEYSGTLADAVRNNSFRATGAGAITITPTGAANATSTSLVVNTADYADILSAATALNYNVSDVPSWLGVGQVIVKDFTSTKYKPIVLKAGSYNVAYTDFDKFDWYNIMNNTMKNEVVTLASGALFEPSSAVVFTKVAATGDLVDPATTDPEKASE